MTLKRKDALAGAALLQNPLTGRTATIETDPTRVRNIILLLTASVALMMTGFGIIMPIFGRRLDELGGGVETLGLMTMAFALAQLIAAPVMGSLSDRLGRRPVVLFSLAAFSIVNIGYLLATSTAGFVVMRGLAGALTAGLFPASMSIVADLVPEKERARWIGMVMGGYGFGLIFGPVLGGLLYDRWGFAAPFVVSAVLGVIALIVAALVVPETRPPAERKHGTVPEPQAKAGRSAVSLAVIASLPRPLHIFGLLLLLDFIGAFAFAFIEPQMVFYVYDELGWSTVQFGLAVGVYGLAMVLGQTLLGQTSDRFGRKPVIILGMLLNTTLFVGLVLITSFGWLMVISAIAGLGAALIAPAVSAFYLDITKEQHRSRVLGIKESALALGGVAGPSMVVVASALTTAHGVFSVAAVLMLAAALLALILLREPRHPDDNRAELVGQAADKVVAADASSPGVVS
jgi:multidrug resistance protein